MKGALSLMKSRRIVGFWLSIIAAIIATYIYGCGGGNKTNGPKTYQDGRVFFYNKLYFPIDVTYINETLGAITTRVNSGETKEVTSVSIKGGTEIIFEISKITSAAGVSMTDKVKVVVDGNVTVQAIGIGAYGQLVEYTGGTLLTE